MARVTTAERKPLKPSKAPIKGSKLGKTMSRLRAGGAFSKGRY